MTITQKKPVSPEERGFTLVELLIVIAIIAALALITMTVAPRISRSAKTTASMGNLRQIHALMMGFVTENNGKYPMSVYQDEPGSPTWRRKIWEHSNGTFDGSPPAVMKEMQNSGYSSVMWCPMMLAQHGQDQHPEGRGSYSLNRFFMPPAWGGGIRRAASDMLEGRREPYIAAGTPFRDNKSFGTFYHLDSAKYPYDTYWSNVHYAYGSDGESALGLYVNGEVRLTARPKMEALHGIIRDPSTLD